MITYCLGPESGQEFPTEQGVTYYLTGLCGRLPYKMVTILFGPSAELDHWSPCCGHVFENFVTD